MKKTIFFSGTHGVGKTTTIKAIVKKSGIQIFNDIADDHRNPCEKDIFHRQAWRIGKYFSDAIHLEDLETHSDKYILVDRCVYDWLAYTHTFQKQNWLSKEEFRKLQNYYESLFDENLLPKNVIWFDPPYEWSKDRILNRWNEEKKKWNEGDFEYLKVLREVYADMYSNASHINLLHLKSTEINRRINDIQGFIEKTVI